MFGFGSSDRSGRLFGVREGDQVYANEVILTDSRGNHLDWGTTPLTGVTWTGNFLTGYYPDGGPAPRS